MSHVDVSEARDHYATLTIAELRRYQAIVQAQIPVAYKQANTRALEDLQTVDALVADAIHSKAFGGETRPEGQAIPVSIGQPNSVSIADVSVPAAREP